MRVTGACAGLLVLVITLTLAIVPAQVPPAEVEVGIFVLDLGEYDFDTGAFTIDFYIWFRYQPDVAPATFNASGFQLVNGEGTATPLRTLRDPASGAVQEEFRVNANLFSEPNVRDYPFNVERLSIQVEDALWNVSDVVYVPMEDRSGLGEEVVLLGWNLIDQEFSVEPKSYAFGRNVTRAVFEMSFQRAPVPVFVNNFLPPLLFAAVSALAFGINPGGVPERVGVSTGALIASVFFHTSLKQTVPREASLILFDRFMISAYVFILGTLIVSVLSAAAARSPGVADHVVRRVNLWGAVATFATTLVLWLLLAAL